MLTSSARRAVASSRDESAAFPGSALRWEPLNTERRAAESPRAGAGDGRLGWGDLGSAGASTALVRALTAVLLRCVANGGLRGRWPTLWCILRA